jgi:hypothetical protein
MQSAAARVAEVAALAGRTGSSLAVLGASLFLGFVGGLECPTAAFAFAVAWVIQGQERTRDFQSKLLIYK